MTNNYYSIINGYSRYFWKSTNKYYPNTNFDDISTLYFLDREIKFAFLKATLEAEKHLKSITAYTLTEKYRDDPLGYLSESFYTYNVNDKRQFKDVAFLTKRFKKIISKHTRLPGNNPIKNHKNNHDGVPFWVMVEYLTFGELKLVIKYVTIPLYPKNYKSRRILQEEYCSHLLKIFLKLEIFVRMIHDYWILNVEIIFYISHLCMIDTTSPLMPPKVMFIILF